MTCDQFRGCIRTPPEQMTTLQRAMVIEHCNLCPWCNEWLDKLAVEAGANLTKEQKEHEDKVVERLCNKDYQNPSYRRIVEKSLE